MKEQVKLPVIIVIAIAAVGLMAWGGMKAMSAGDLDQGQVKYTPGKPPWEESDPSKKGPGGAPGGGGPGASSPTPPGMSPPIVGNGQ